MNETAHAQFVAASAATPLRAAGRERAKQLSDARAAFSMPGKVDRLGLQAAAPAMEVLRMNPLAILWKTALGMAWLAVFAAASVVGAANPPSASAPGSLLPPWDPAAFKLGGKNAADARIEAVNVSGQPFQKALRVETLKRPPYPWNITLFSPTTNAMCKGDVLLAILTARRIMSRQETGEALTEVIVEESTGEHHKLLEFATSVGPEWTIIRAPFAADKDYPAGAAQLSIRFGYQPQIIELAAVSLTNYGKTVALGDLPSTRARYAGWEPSAPWRRAAAERIEKIRQGDLRVEVVDANGTPVPNARVSLRMRRHEFAFGTAIQGARIVSSNRADDEHYRQIIAQYFNKAVFENDLKWPRWDTNRTDWQQHRAAVLAAIDWLHARNIAVRGHVMIWPSWENTPGWLRQFESQPGRLRAAIDAHLADQTAALKGRLAEWDVINESRSASSILTRATRS